MYKSCVEAWLTFSDQVPPTIIADVAENCCGWVLRCDGDARLGLNPCCLT